MPVELKRVAVILEGRVQYERNLLLGIRDFVAESGDWLIRLEMPGLRRLTTLTSKPDGILFQAAGLSRETLEELSQTSTPCVHLSDEPEGFDFLHVGLDNREIGRLAARYFLKRHFRSFAFVGVQGVRFSRIREESFKRALQDSGHKLVSTNLNEGRPDEPKDLRWLQRLPKSTALFAAHDECSLYLTTLCRGAGIRVPEDIAVLGVDDDELICELAAPKLSSISVPSRLVGQEAARRLDQMMHGDRQVESALLPPSGVISRHSTEVHRTDDEIVNRSLRFMRSHLHRRINVDDVLRETGVSRRLLERKFQSALGRTPLQEIQRLRMELAERLLVEGNATLQEIASACGCRDASHLVTLFRRTHGETPGQFRERSHRGKGKG